MINKVSNVSFKSNVHIVDVPGLNRIEDSLSYTEIQEIHKAIDKLKENGVDDTVELFPEKQGWIYTIGLLVKKVKNGIKLQGSTTIPNVSGDVSSERVLEGYTIANYNMDIVKPSSLDKYRY